MVPCWGRHNTYTSNDAPFCTGNYKVSEPASLFFYSDHSTQCIASLPKLSGDIDIRSLLLDYQVIFSYSATIAEVGVLDSPGNYASFTPVDTIPVVYNNWRARRTTFEHYAGSGKVIAFRFTGGNYGSNM